MNRQKSNTLHFSLLILMLITALLINSPKAKAQNEPTENKLLKYELSIDLVPIIDQGQFGKVYFKKNHYKEDQLKGAYRFGVLNGSYLHDKVDISSLPENVTTSFKTASYLRTNLSFGYEKYIHIGTVLTYFGIDVSGSLRKDHHTPINYTDDQKIYTLGICPFWGLKHYILKDRISTSFEIGWQTIFSKNINQFDGFTYLFKRTEILLPYNFTINYHF